MNINDVLHEFFNKLPRFSYPYDKKYIPKNGIYVMFESGEKYKNMDRIVRIGTHRGQDNLPNRLDEHFIKKNHNRSIFIKNIGRALLHNNKKLLEIWNIDTTPSNINIDPKYINIIKYYEELSSRYIRDNISFVVFEISNKDQRLFWESYLIGTIANSSSKPSPNWLGLKSPIEKIRQYGLWQTQHLKHESMDKNSLEKLFNIIERSI